MAGQVDGAWVVLKFGGSSVSRRETWDTIARVVTERLDEGLRPLVVCSAVGGVTNDLEALLAAALRGDSQGLLGLREKHIALGDALGVDAAVLLASDFKRLDRLVQGIELLGEISPRIRARVMAAGELMSTRLGAAFLDAACASAGWLDARDCLAVSTPAPTDPQRRFLQATCDAEPDPTLGATLGARVEAVLVTQGFLARDGTNTVLLGRGGSDTSASYLAARLSAGRCEIWADVPGMFTANPRLVPAARLLMRLDYLEAQEIASAGAHMLHPRCLAPLAAHNIPLHIKSTLHPEASGTAVQRRSPDPGPRVKAICARREVALVTMETAGMWQQVGFLADAFACFKKHGISLDLVSTSEMNVTVSLDTAANPWDYETRDRLLKDLRQYCATKIIGPCAAVSLVGRHIRRVLPRLGPALSVFQEQRIHLVSQAASDLNLTFVVDEDQAERLVSRLHEHLFEGAVDDPALGATWRELEEGPAPEPPPAPTPWWERRREDLLAEAAKGTPAYVYDADSLGSAVSDLQAMDAVSRVFFAIKANPHPGILRQFEATGIGFECVSPGEVTHLQGLFPELDPERLLFTPNFAPRVEYEQGFDSGAWVTVDNLTPLQWWPDAFAGRDILLRLDPGQGRGHHAHVKTAGTLSKFGIPASQFGEVAAAAEQAGARIVGLHAHAGSGILTPGNWRETALFLAEAARRHFPAVKRLDLGGGLGVVERPGQQALDLSAVNDSLTHVREAYPDLELWLEPGRFLVARAGVLLARVTQTKAKGDQVYVGVDAGMNSLIRPALYGAWHHIVNLTRLEEPATQIADIVGPICETGDVLGRARRIAPAQEGDVLLIAVGGAYGRAMSSNYNLREPARECLLGPSAG